LSTLPDIAILHSDRGLRLDQLYYPKFGSVSIEATGGYAVLGTTVVNGSFRSLYVDTWDEGERIGSMFFLNCFNLEFYSFACELAGTSSVVGGGWFHFQDCHSVNFFGGRVNHYSTQELRSIFLIENVQGFNVSALLWEESTDNMTFLSDIGSTASK